MVIEITEKKDLFEYLYTDRALSTYFIGDLNDPYFKRCEWFADTGPSRKIKAIVLLYHHPAITTMLSLGDPEGVGEILKQKIKTLPCNFHSHLYPEHIQVFEKFYTLSGKTRHLRMVVEREKAIYHCKDKDYSKISLLSKKDTPAILKLLDNYPDNFFSETDLESQYYYGIYEGKNLVTMSGVHVISTEYRVAALGNVVTDRNYRRKQNSLLCTEYLMKKLFEVVDIISLNVGASNTPAVNLYKKLGYYCYREIYLSFCSKM